MNNILTAGVKTSKKTNEGQAIIQKNNVHIVVGPSDHQLVIDGPSDLFHDFLANLNLIKNRVEKLQGSNIEKFVTHIPEGKYKSTIPTGRGTPALDHTKEQK